MLVVKRTMKIIHTADWHLGQTFYGFDRSNEHAVFLDWMCSTIKERGATLLLVAGDVFDTPNPSAKAQKMFYSFLTRVTNENPDLQIIITAGNHDSAARIEAPSSMLNVFNVFVSGVVHYVDGEIDYDRMIVPVAGGGCCLAVPFLRHNDHPAAESYSQGVAKLYAELCRRAAEKGYSPIVAMGHLQASGAEVSVGDVSEYATIGGMEGIGYSFANDGIAYTALGHLHKAQSVGHRENVRYSGSPLPMSFAERGNRQGVAFVCIEDGECLVEKIEFDAPAKLLSVPVAPQPIEEVLELLGDLPTGDVDDFSPFLEVNVLVTSIDPTLRQRIEDSIAGKAVRLARINATGGERSDNGTRGAITFEDFKRKSPKEILCELYARDCGNEMPQHLANLLDDVMKGLENEDIGNKR